MTRLFLRLHNDRSCFCRANERALAYCHRYFRVSTEPSQQPPTCLPRRSTAEWLRDCDLSSLPSLGAYLSLFLFFTADTLWCKNRVKLASTILPACATRYPPSMRAHANPRAWCQEEIGDIQRDWVSRKLVRKIGNNFWTARKLTLR